MVKQNGPEYKVINDVHYEMSKQDYEVLSSCMQKINEILTRATVVENDNSAVPPRFVATHTVAKPVKKEKLTIVALKYLLGANYSHTCIYNNETRTLLTKKYNGADVYSDNRFIRASNNLKEMFDTTFPRFEQVAQVTIQVSKADYPGRSKWTKGDVKFDKKGRYIVANLIIRDKLTGYLYLMNPGWFGASLPEAPDSMENSIAFVFPCLVAYVRYRRDLFAGFAPTR